MERRILLGALMIGCVALIPPAAQPGQKAEKSDSKIRASAQLSKPDPDGAQTLTVVIDIEKGWYIYANPAGYSSLEKSRTQIAVKAKEPVFVGFAYPKGKTKKQGSVTYQAYEDRVVIQGKILRAGNDRSPLDVSITVSACNEFECLKAGTVTLRLP